MKIHRLDTEALYTYLSQSTARIQISERFVAIGCALTVFMLMGLLVAIRSLAGRVVQKQPLPLDQKTKPNGLEESPTPVPFSETALLAEASYKKIDQVFYDIVLKDTKKHLDGNTARELLKDITNFYQTFPVNRSDVGLMSIRAQVENVEKNLKWLSEQGPILYSYRVHNLSGDVIPMPDQGNCLFDAVFFQLKSTSIKNAQDLRAQTVEWMGKSLSDKKLCGYIDLSIEAFKAAKSKDLKEQEEVFKLMEREEQPYEQYREKHEVWKKEKAELENLTSYQHYLKLVAQDKFFGSITEIYAMTRQLGVNIHVHKVFDGKALEAYDEEFYLDPPAQTTLHLTHENGNHFNSVKISNQN
ncbi:MAG: hypothetical protein JSR58_03725 [Verrucomicrobia bacterium]|nr:hypothetical protein [Verrucomicrobiota bacterium]